MQLKLISSLGKDAKPWYAYVEKCIFVLCNAILRVNIPDFLNIFSWTGQVHSQNRCLRASIELAAMLFVLQVATR